MNIFFIGFKSVGKSTFAKLLSKKINFPSFDLDDLIEQVYQKKNNVKKKVREIFKEHGEDYFRELEREALQSIPKKEKVIVALGGGTLYTKSTEHLIKERGFIIFLRDDKEKIKSRIFSSKELPAYLDKKNPEASFEEYYQKREQIYKNAADMTLSLIDKSQDQVLNALEKLVLGVFNEN